MRLHAPNHPCQSRGTGTCTVPVGPEGAPRGRRQHHQKLLQPVYEAGVPAGLGLPCPGGHVATWPPLSEVPHAAVSEPAH
jgi:hypothetical protein